LPALGLHTLIALEQRAAIPTACILFSGIIVLLITVTHTLLQAFRVSRHSLLGASPSLYQNDSAQQAQSSASDLAKDGAEPRPRPEIHRKFSFPPFLEHKSQLGSVASSNPSSWGREGSEQPRMHRTLSVESGLLQAQGKAWNVITEEMGNVMARKPRASGKDSTLV
ncbi:TM221 protein, partial [Cephalopterus ornatus]|nr:TM221 protein [Cephalopterus ornatus]